MRILAALVVIYVMAMAVRWVLALLITAVAMIIGGLT